MERRLFNWRMKIPWSLVLVLILQPYFYSCIKFSDDIVVQIEGGDDMAEDVGELVGYEVLGKVLPDSDLYHMKAKSSHPRHKRSAKYVETELKSHPSVLEIHKQKVNIRVKRDNMDKTKREPTVREQCFVSTKETEKTPSRRCVFPFNYKGTEYNRCTSDHSDNKQQWCATSVYGDGGVVVGEWGDCDFDNIDCRLLSGAPPLKTPTPSPIFPPSDISSPPIRQRPPQLAPRKTVVDTPRGPPPNTPFLPAKLPRLPLRSRYDIRPLPRTLEEFLLLLGPRGGGPLTKSKSRPPLVQDTEELEDLVPKNTMERFTDKEWPNQWYLNRGGQIDMNVEEAWDLGFSGEGVTVTILDDGVEWNHPDLSRNYREVASFDINQNDKDPFPRYDLFDTNKHGTRCAGQVSAEANNSVCSVGIAFNSGIGGVRMLDGTITDAVEARSLSLNPQNIDIYSASWGPDDDGRTVDGPGPLTRRAMEDGVTKGRQGLGSIYVWASGNGGKFQDNCNCDGYATSIYTLSVSSASENGNIPWYSEQCSSTLATTYSSGSTRLGERKVITTDLHNRCTSSHTGTSASSPMAAGIVALVLEANSNLTWRDIQHIVVRSAKHANLEANDWNYNGAGYNVSHAFGFGLMDAGEMVKRALEWNTVPDQRRCQIDWVGDDVSIRPGEQKELELAVNTNPESNDACDARVMEHVHLTLDVSSRSKRGEFSILLKSPSGTVSTLLAPRPLDNSISGFANFRTWPLMTVHNWGENPGGVWTLVVINGGSRTAYLEGWRLIIYGTEEKHNM